MSYQATGAVVFLPGAVILLAGGAVVGTGVLIGKGVAQGIMWCHDKMEENYRSAAQTFTALQTKAEAELRTRSSERADEIVAYIERYTSGDNLTAPLGGANTQEAAVDPRILAALQQAREALGSAQQLPMSYQTEIERRKLAMTIRASRGIVTPATLKAAETALNGSSAEMKTARENLDASVQALADTHARQQRISNESRVTLEDARSELQTARMLVAQRGEQVEPDAAARFKLIQQKIEDSANIGEQNAETALVVAREALQLARDAVYHAATAIAGDWSDQQRHYARVEGQLKALDDLVSDIEVGRLAAPQRITIFRGRIATLNDTIARAKATLTPPAEALPPIEATLAALKDEAFAETSRGQQNYISKQIADTLRELGFESADEDNTPPSVETLGDSARIAVRRIERKPDGRREDHLVYFSVDTKGRVSYDFAGYDRHECADEAERVFKALRKRGILLMDSSRLAALDAEHTNATDLLADDVLPDASMNKRQPHVQQALLDVLTRSMGFEHVDQIILGGTIELDAYNGPVGHRYHVEITPEGGTTIQRDGADVTGSMDDQVATAATAVKIVDVPPTVEHEIASSYNPISQWGPHSIGQPE